MGLDLNWGCRPSRGNDDALSELHLFKVQGSGFKVRSSKFRVSTSLPAQRCTPAPRMTESCQKVAGSRSVAETLGNDDALLESVSLQSSRSEVQCFPTPVGVAHVEQELGHPAPRMTPPRPSALPKP